MKISIKTLKDLRSSERDGGKIREIVSSSIAYGDRIAEMGDYFEAGEFLYSAAQIVEEIDPSRAEEIFLHNIRLWEKLIESFKAQAKFHEIAEIYLKVADLCGEKLHDYDREKSYLLESIDFLKQESDLLKDFNQSRTLAQNYQNIAELYFQISDFRNSILYYQNVIEISKEYVYYDLLSYSYQQIAVCFKELDDYNKAKNILLEGVEFFADLSSRFEEKNDNLALAQMCQILKNLYLLLNDDDQFLYYSKKEAGAYINLAEGIEKTEENYHKIARYYRGAGLCYQETHKNNLIEAASCFVLAGNYSNKIDDYNEAAISFFDAANVFKELKNWDMTYKSFIKAGDNYWKINDVNLSTESYLNAYDIAIEGSLEFNRFGVFSQIIRGLNKISEESLKSKEFYSSATLILESIKFYEQLDIAKDFLLKDMVRNVYKYYYRAANLKKVVSSHIIHSYVLAALSSILIRRLDKALEIMSEITAKGKTVELYKKMIKLIIEKVIEKKPIEIEGFPYNIKRLIESSEEITYLLSLFKRL